MRFDEDFYLTVRDNETTGEKENCNNFATVKNGYITYKSLNGSDEELNLINKSNLCAVDKALQKYLAQGYKADKKEYLKILLSTVILQKSK